jgi:uncharacterized membrane protein
MLELVVALLSLLPIAVLILLAVNHSRLSRLKQELRKVESAVAALQVELGNLRDGADRDRAVGGRPAQAGPPPGHVPATAPPAAAPPPSAPIPELFRPETPAAPPGIPPPVPAPVRAAAKSRTREELELLVGGKLLNRIGALALVLAAGFFLKYAFDNNLISETARVLLGGAAGVGLLAAAERARRKGLSVFAQGLVGAGIAILYLSVYASFSFYRLLPQGAAYALMTVVTLIAILQAFRTGSLAVAMLGWAGGFLTPVLLDSGDAFMVGRLTYLALLAAGMLAVTMLRPGWSFMDLLTLGATHLHFLGWVSMYYQPEVFGRALYFALLYWALFAGFELYRMRKLPSAGKEVREIIGAVNALLIVLWLHTLLEPTRHDWFAPVLLALASVYAAAAVLVPRGHTEAGVTPVRHALTAVAFVVVATAVQETGHLRFVLWAAEALMLVLLGSRLEAPYLRKAGAALIVLAVVGHVTWGGLVALDLEAEGYRPVLNARTGALAAMMVSAWGMGLLFRRRGEKTLAAVMDTLWPFLLLAGATVEVSDLFRRLIAVSADGLEAERLRFIRLMAVAGAWIALSIPLVREGSRRNAPALRIAGTAAFAGGMMIAAMNGFGYHPIELFTPVLNARAAMLAFAAAAGVVHILLLRTSPGRGGWDAAVAAMLRIAVPLLLLELATTEVWDFFRKMLLSALPGEIDQVRLVNLQQLSFSGVWLLFSIGLMAVGLWRRARPWRVMAIALFGVAILKIFVYDLSFLGTLYRFLSFGVLGVILLATSYLYTRYRSVIFGASSTDQPAYEPPDRP